MNLYKLADEPVVNAWAEVYPDLFKRHRGRTKKKRRTGTSIPNRCKEAIHSSPARDPMGRSRGAKVPAD